VMLKTPEDNEWEIVYDNPHSKKLTSMSFRKNRRSNVWSSLETDLFYEVLAATGTDFYLMHDFLPKRNRAELKKKFSREEKNDPVRIDETLRKPALLDDSLYARVDKLAQEIEDYEEKPKVERKSIRSIKGTSKKDPSDDDDDDEELL